MSCQHCVMAVKKEISKLNVESLDVKIGEAKVRFNEINIKPEDIKKSITDAGYIVVE
ncbi:MAG TPA: copper resistance protein CopZ [Ignavibacteriales bacterium]|nr:copper resistance protein CopZ [Ignavibacteriales bacterium]